MDAQAQRAALERFRAEWEAAYGDAGQAKIFFDGIAEGIKVIEHPPVSVTVVPSSVEARPTHFVPAAKVKPPALQTQKEAEAESPPPGGYGLCTAINSKGHPCQNEARYGQFCKRHRGY